MTSTEAQATFAFLRQLKERATGTRLTIEEMRAAGEQFGALTAEPAGVTYTPADVAGIPGQWIEPADATGEGTLLFLHGGGYMMGSVNSHKWLIGHIAKAVGVRSLAIDYRLAPENPHPAQVEDAVTAYRWLLEAGHDPARLAMAGDSAGGGLTMLTLLRLRADGVPPPAAAVLLSPWVDLEGSGESLKTRADVDLLITAQGSRHAAEAFLPGGGFRDPTVSPLHADLSGLPPIYVQVGDHEVLLDDSTRLDERLRAAGVDVRLDVFPEMQHVFQMSAGNMPEADDAVARIGAWLAPRLAG
ncbi:acetyl esterase/lipase [Thermocatellispora tengchongensis]|uniref:Acetyl esterase/lipase n=1 Tax=Thermocatellispora tengchongensis TaxID=1073253 RepID=A0A840PL53_9ACTN|nr:alpha/beta hydrolase [Thermocatellispora tengchongensis]MBB5139646.1 acetyl esterase/lipase [Thermocatellispora tengchongensis]